jgi:pimeloyl-ACP methyl ester carboxylesterase
MQEVIEARELFTLKGLGPIVRGTHHLACAPVPGSGPVGLVILNSLSPTRAAAGDSAVYWADSFAKYGYPVFRLDLPGFGDSEGNPPAELLKVINSGGYGPTAAVLIKELSQRFSLSGVVVMGLCAGALSAIYTAAASEECKGLVLLDPYFQLPLPPPSWLWQKLTGRFLRSAPGRRVENALGRLTDIRLKLRRNPLPENSNYPLLKCWKKVASAGLPILLFKAPNIKPRGKAFDYLSYIVEQAGINSRVQVKVIAGAGHTFSNRAGKTAIQQQTELWLEACFPLQDEFALRSLSPAANDIKSGDQYRLDYLHH